MGVPIPQCTYGYTSAHTHMPSCWADYSAIYLWLRALWHKSPKQRRGNKGSSLPGSLLCSVHVVSFTLVLLFAPTGCHWANFALTWIFWLPVMDGDVTGSAKQTSLSRTEGSPALLVPSYRRGWSGGEKDGLTVVAEASPPLSQASETRARPPEHWYTLNLTFLFQRPLNPQTHFSKEERTLPTVVWSAFSFQKRINTHLSMR